MPSLHVALVAPQIHWNTGNAGRTCLAAGATLHLIEPLAFSMDAKQVRRAGLDYWSRVPVEMWPDFASFERALPELGEPYLLSPEGSQTVWDVSYPERTVLLFGNETEGFAKSIRGRYTDRLLSIPMHDRGLRSLNLSTSIGIALYEVLRQRSTR